MGVGLAAVSIGLSLYSGITQYSAAQAQAKLYEEQGAENAREAYREAGRIEDEGNRFAQKQKLAYIGSGVQFGGSAVVTVAQTKKWVKTEADAMRKRGTALQKYGYTSAGIARTSGRAALIGSIAQSISYGSILKGGLSSKPTPGVSNG